MDTNITQTDLAAGIRRRFIQVIIVLLIQAAILFIAAGRLAWAMAWGLLWSKATRFHHVLPISCA